MFKQSFILFLASLFFFSCQSQPEIKSNSKRNILISSNIETLLNEKQWNELFPNRYNISKYEDDESREGIKKFDFYTYRSFVEATKKFPMFLHEGDSIQQKRELCAFLANISLETSGGWDEAEGGYYKWGLYFMEENGCKKGCPAYSDVNNKNYPPIKGRSYHGRGPMQISWNYNYGQLSEVLFGTKDSLLQRPEMLTSNATISFASAMWFWMTAQMPKPSCHDAMTGKWIPNAKDSIANRLPGFGATVNIINGGIECGIAKKYDKTKYRYGYYLYFCKYFNVSPGDNIECTTQKPFGK
jgi:hypothetical protein